MQKYYQEADVFFTLKSSTTGMFNCIPDILVYYYLLQKKCVVVGRCCTCNISPLDFQRTARYSFATSNYND